MHARTLLALLLTLCSIVKRRRMESEREWTNGAKEKWSAHPTFDPRQPDHSLLSFLRASFSKQATDVVAMAMVRPMQIHTHESAPSQTGAQTRRRSPAPLSVSADRLLLRLSDAVRSTIAVPAGSHCFNQTRHVGSPRGRCRCDPPRLHAAACLTQLAATQKRRTGTEQSTARHLLQPSISTWRLTPQRDGG